MSIEHPSFPGGLGEVERSGKDERPDVAKIGEAAAELVKGGPAIGREWIGNFETTDGRSVRVWMPNFPRMASGAVGDVACQIEVTYPRHVISQGHTSQYKEIWNLSTNLDLGLTLKVEIMQGEPTQMQEYRYPSDQVGARASLAEQAALRGESRLYRRATDEEEGEVLSLLQDLKAS